MKVLVACEESQTVTKELRKLGKEINEMGGIDHLRELVQAEQDGRLVVLPCKVGRLVWSMNNNGGVCSHLDDFGKTVFLTREEAEAALEAQV